MDLRDLSTLAAIADNGSLEAAAKALNVTASAVSQRLAKLEGSIGYLLVVRENPARLTKSGEALLRVSRQIDELLGEARTEIADVITGSQVVVAVHHDSLASWFVRAMASFQDETGRMMEVIGVDHTATRSLLRSGTVAAAISSEPSPLPGCVANRIGVLKYWAVVAPNKRDAVSTGSIPLITFDREDSPTLAAVARLRTVTANQSACYIPSVHDIRIAALQGVGWAVCPEPLVAEDLAKGDLETITPEPVLEIELYLHCWRSENKMVDALRRAVKSGFDGPRTKAGV